MELQIEKNPHKELPSADVKLTQANRAFEALAQRMDTLMGKMARRERLTIAEQREVDLIYNNAMVLQDVIEGRMPEEFKKAS